MLHIFDKRNTMIEKHVNDTLEGILSVVGAITLGGISVTNIGSVVGIISGLFAIVASSFAIRYYWFATKKTK